MRIVGIWCGLVRGLAIGIGTLLFGLAHGVSAEEDPPQGDPAAQNEKLRQEIEAQGERIAELESKLGQSPPNSAAIDSLMAKFSKYPLTFTGFLKADMLYGTHRTNGTDAPRFLALEPALATRHDDFFSATVQHSRFALKWQGPQLSGGSLRALVETDLFTLGDTGSAKFNNAQFRLRQLYFDLDWKRWNVLAGQAWDVFSPLGPSTLNTNGYYWFGGNAGFRRPQLRATHRLPVADGTRIDLVASVNSNIGAARVDPLGRPLDTGEDAGQPVYEGATTLYFPAFAGRTGQLGASGLYGHEEADGLDGRIEQWAAGGHAELPLAAWAVLRGEIQHGVNTDAFLAGGSFDATGHPIKATSGWVQASLGPFHKLTTDLTFGLEDFDADRLPTGARDRNQLIGAGLRYQLFDPLVVGFEYTRFITDFKNSHDENGDLFWLSAIFSF